MGKRPAISFMIMPLRGLFKKEIFKGVFMTLSNTYDEIFYPKAVNIF